MRLIPTDITRAEDLSPAVRERNDAFTRDYQRGQIAYIRKLATNARRAFERTGERERLLRAQAKEAQADRLEAVLGKSQSTTTS